MLSPDVAGFLAAHIRSVDGLHVLMTLIETEDRWWDAQSLGRELLITPGAARRALEWLTQHNLLDVRVTDDIRYQFAPGTEQLRTAALASAEAYRVNPVAVVQHVTNSSRRSVRDFADAFRIRRDDDDR